MAEKSGTVIVVGSGISGLATALGVALQGRSVVVFEAAELIGGASAYSGGQVWVGGNHVAAAAGIDDDVERTERYVRAIASEYPELLDEQAMRRWITTAPHAVRYWEEVGAIRWTVIPGLADYHAEADGALGEGRYLTNEVIDGSALGEWRERFRVSPYFPVGTTYADMFVKGRRGTVVDDDGIADHAGVPSSFGRGERRDEAVERDQDPLTFGTGVVASFFARVLQEDRIELRPSHRVTELLTDDDGAVVGVRAQGPDGTVEERGPVVLATSSYDWDPELVQEFLGLEPGDFGSAAPQSIRGDAIKLVRAVGGAVARIPATSVPILPGWASASGTGFTYGPEYALPHCLIVDENGRRFADDSYWVDIVNRALKPDDRHLPFFLIWDDRHRRKYGLGTTPPGGDYPEGMVTSGATLAEVAAGLGVDATQLEATVARFNEHAEQGEDPDFGRGTVTYVRHFAGDPEQEPNPLLGTVAEAPFHGMRMRFVGMGIGSSGVHIDGDGHVLDETGEPIRGLYAVGSCAALTTVGSGHNSGFTLSRGVTLAYLVSHELGGTPVRAAFDDTAVGTRS